MSEITLLGFGQGVAQTLGMAGYIVLVLLPGAWIASGLHLRGLPGWARLLAGATLSPLVTVAEFYVLRLLGLPFGQTALALVVVNLPAVLLVARRFGAWTRPERRTVLGVLGVACVPLACLAPILLSETARIYTGHAWMYSDPIYQIARGDLVPDDPELAGLRLAYAWGGLLYQGLLSFLIGSPPAVSYIWTNIIWLAIIFGFTAATVAELGGGRFARVTSLIWLLFGLNFVGYVVEQLGMTVTGYYFVGSGDYRFTPWLLKFFFFQQDPMALGMLSATGYFLVRRSPLGLARDSLLVIGLLLCSVAIIYPILFPAIAALVGAKAIALALGRSGTWRPRLTPEVFGICLVLAISALVTLVHVKFVTQDVIAATVRLSVLKLILIKVVTTGLVLLPLLAGLVIVFPGLWRSARESTAVLVLAALGCGVLFSLFSLPGFGAEYKFLMAAAVCLAPFPSLAFARLSGHLGRWTVPTFAVLTVVLTVPLDIKLYRDFPWMASGVQPLAVDVTSFDLRLAPGESWASVSDAVRDRTPSQTVLVVERADVHLPTLTHRNLYAPPIQQLPHPGVNILSEDLLREAKGYSVGLLEQRKATLESLFHPAIPSDRDQALERMLALERPLAIVLDKHVDADLLGWLGAQGGGEPVYADTTRVVWLMPATLQPLPDTVATLPDSGRSH